MSTETKCCSKCLIDKDLSLFSKHKAARDGYQAWCKLCLSNYGKEEYNRQRKQDNQRYRRRTDPEYIKRENKNALARYEADPRLFMLSAARGRAKKGNYPCTITLDDIVIPELCPLLEVPLVRRSKLYQPSLDKIIPELGYVPGNVIVISMKANWMKNNASFDELKAFGTNILKFIERWKH